MNKPTELDLAYYAGFFDGEGSVTIHLNCRPSPRGVSPNHTLQVSIGNTNPVVLSQLHKHFGGGYVWRIASKPNQRNQAMWILRAAKALPFLVAIRPYIRMKDKQVDVAIRYQKTKKMGHGGPGNFISKEVVAWREKQRQKIKQLNAEELIPASLCRPRSQIQPRKSLTPLDQEAMREESHVS